RPAPTASSPSAPTSTTPPAVPATPWDCSYSPSPAIGSAPSPASTTACFHASASPEPYATEERARFGPTASAAPFTPPSGHRLRPRRLERVDPVAPPPGGQGRQTVLILAGRFVCSGGRVRRCPRRGGCRRRRRREAGVDAPRRLPIPTRLLVVHGLNAAT